MWSMSDVDEALMKAEVAAPCGLPCAPKRTSINSDRRFLSVMSLTLSVALSGHYWPSSSLVDQHQTASALNGSEWPNAFPPEILVSGHGSRKPMNKPDACH